MPNSETAGTETQTPEVQPEGTATPVAASTAGTPDFAAEVTTLRSRNSGLDAKVTELQKAQAARDQEAKELREQLAALQDGKVSADEAANARVQAKDSELAEMRKQLALTKIASKYPETFGVLGDAAAGLTEDQLAASEARMTGVESASTGTPAVLGASSGRQPAPQTKNIEDMSVKELEAQIAQAHLGTAWGLPT